MLFLKTFVFIVCVYVYVCMFACMCVWNTCTCSRKYMCVDVFEIVCGNICIHAWVHVCVCMCHVCTFVYVGQVHHSTYVEVRGQLCGTGSLFLPLNGFQGSRFCRWTCKGSTLLSEPPWQPQLFFLGRVNWAHCKRAVGWPGSRVLPECSTVFFLVRRNLG